MSSVRSLDITYTDEASERMRNAPRPQRGRIENGLRVVARKRVGSGGPGTLHTPTHAVGYTVQAGRLVVYAVLQRSEALRLLFGDELYERIEGRRWQKILHGRRGAFEMRPPKRR